VNLPDSITHRLPVLIALEEPWEPMTRAGVAAWLVFYGFLLAGGVSGGGLLRYFDLVFVPIHEGGHLLFSWLGKWLMVAGGTLLQLFAPFALAVYFAFRRQLAGTAFCAFFFFEQLLPVATYMADSRSQSLTYVTVGDPDMAEHDWAYLFASVRMLEHDTQIAAVVRSVGWIGMLAVVAWLAWQGWPRRVAR
jgi:hypothetical protein